ncbi:Rpn family recombination-promoting nuclease/putative transposase [uncultured Holdemanella sp.]|uniref:Rpn family recombination-promoting nuclease/putative transposase n=1 Tax=uncultured Holdemanella sp. TaxID=1763549 RepID=UPI002588B3DA|nr:Rpn family recombination-promoting nuclease/putative transposase [uncultured Holdemanella sp.]
MNKSKDKIMKEFLENNAYFVDFFNAYFFDGERVLKPENCMELDSEMNDSNMDLEKHVDVIRKYNDGNLYSAFIIENQSCVDPSMVVRAAVYEYVAYERMLKKSKKNKAKEKLPMVNILVFYTGERPWNAASKLSELVEVDERFTACFHDYKMNLIEIKGNTSYNFNEEDVHNLFYICRSIYDQSIYEGTSNHFGLVKSTVLKVVKTLTDVEWLDLEELEEKEEIEMCEAEKRWLEVKSKEWEAEGIRKGIEQGIERGIEQGIEQGSEKKELEMYQTMVDKGFSISSIASIFSVSEESIERLLMKA